MPTDHQLLLEVARQSSETHALVKVLSAKVLGNGQQGLLQNVAALKQGHDDITERLDRIEADVPSKTEKRTMIGSAVTGGVLVVVTVLARLLGIPLPGSVEGGP